MTEEDTLVATVGLPRAGKSTWISKMVERHGWPVVEVDGFRYAIHGSHYNKQAEPLVWSHVKVAVRALFHEHHDVVILDSMMATEERRSLFSDENFQTVFKEFHTPPEVCIERAEECGQDFLVPVIKRIDKVMDPMGVDDMHFEDWYELMQDRYQDFGG